ncbi:TPA: phage tail sheath family protein [Enterobacter bugandensis]|nr:phage tail sheath family protein [Enterobacter bugandensis]
MLSNLPFPGVDVKQSWIKIPAAQQTAVPVFAGFCLNGEPGKLYEIVSEDDFRQQMGAAVFYSEKFKANVESVLPYALRHYFDNGGRRCFILNLINAEALSIADLVKHLTDPALWQSVESQEEITLIVAPDSIHIPDTDTSSWIRVWQHLLNVANKCRAHALLDAPEAADQVKKCLDTERFLYEECGSVYWPRLLTAYETGQPAARLYTNNGRQNNIILSASAAVAALIGLNDLARGTWSAPANLPIAKTIKPTQKPHKGAGLFNVSSASINLIRSFPLRGVRIWGCRTLAQGNENNWKLYIQTHRTALLIEQALKRLCHFSVFEPNTQATWLKMKGLTMTWLNDLWQKGGLAGTSASEAYQIYVGLNESMTQDEINNGQLIMHIQVALQRPAEFVSLHLEFMVEQGRQNA